MAQHKWHKEIKAWADGGDIELRFSDRKNHFDDWSPLIAECWDDDAFEFRIKPQPQYLKVYGWLENQNITFDKAMGMPYIGKIKLEVDDVGSA
jgi:hypothetical protein